MKSKPFIIVGAILLVCAIVLGGLYISGASSTARFDKQLQLGNKFLLEANYEEAIVAFEKAIKIEPKSVDARLGLSMAYIAVDRADDAVAVLEDAMEIDPKRPEPYINLAKIYIDLGELEKAIEILEAGMKNSGDASISALLDEIKPKAPVASVESGKYSEAVTVTFEGIAVNDEVYYTLDNTPPNKESIKYNEPVSLTNGNHVLRAATYRSNGIISAEAMYEYQIDITPEPEQNDSVELRELSVNFFGEIAIQNLAYELEEGDPSGNNPEGFLGYTWISFDFVSSSIPQEFAHEIKTCNIWGWQEIPFTEEEAIFNCMYATQIWGKKDYTDVEGITSCIGSGFPTYEADRGKQFQVCLVATDGLGAAIGYCLADVIVPEI